MKINAAFVLSITLLCSCAFAKKLPASFSICKRNDPELNECFARATEKALQILRKPISELPLPTIDPVKFKSVVIPPSDSDNFKFTQTLTNVEIHNLFNVNITNTNITFTEKEFSLDLGAYASSLLVKGNYELNGKILLLIIEGAGTFAITLDDVSSRFQLSGSIIEKKGRQYLSIKNTTCAITPKTVVFKFDNLFNGNVALGNSINNLLNENWKGIYEEIGYVYEDFVAGYLHGIARVIFEKVPFDDLFPL